MTVLIEEKSLELALVKAAGQLGVTQDDLGYKVVAKANGFLGMFGKKISIEAWSKVVPERRRDRDRGGERNSERNNNRGAGASQSNREVRPRQNRESTQNREASQNREIRERREPRTPREPRPVREDVTPSVWTPEETQALTTELTDFFRTLCSKMVSEDVTMHFEVQDDRLILDVDNETIADLMKKNSKLAEAFEHLIRKKPRQVGKELPFRIFVDSQGMRRKREGELVVMAKDLSDQVFDNRRPIVLNYRSSYDRKIIHMALDKDDRVYTKSIGKGQNRKLMILPSREAGAEIQ